MSVPTAFDVGLLVATIVCIVANAVEVIAKLLRARFVQQNCAAVGIDRKWLPHLAAVEGAGVVGLIVGLAGAPPIGLLASLGLIGFFVVATAVHVQMRVLHNIAFPVLFLALAVASAFHFGGS